MKKFIASIMAFTLSITALVGCNNSKTDNETQGSSSANSILNSDGADSANGTSETEQTYGLTISLNSDLSVPTKYDTSFINDEQIKCISDYFYSMQTKDEALYRKVVLPEYIQQLESLMDEGRDLQKSLDSLYNEVYSQLNSDFEFSLCNVAEGKITDPSNSIATLISDLNEVYSSNHDGITLSDAIAGTDTLMTICNITISKAGEAASDSSTAEIVTDNSTTESTADTSETLSMDNNIIYVVNIDGEYYIIPYVG